MNNLEQVIALGTIGLSLKNKSIRLSGETFKVGPVVVLSDGGDAQMIVHLSLKEKVETCDADCDCHICQASRSLDTENCADVVNLLTKGRSETLILDSCSASDKGFHVKLRNLETRRCDVAEGPNFTIAIARAATKALTP